MSTSAPCSQQTLGQRRWEGGRRSDPGRGSDTENHRITVGPRGTRRGHADGPPPGATCCTAARDTAPKSVPGAQYTLKNICCVTAEQGRCLPSSPAWSKGGQANASLRRENVCARSSEEAMSLQELRRCPLVCQKYCPLAERTSYHWIFSPLYEKLIPSYSTDISGSLSQKIRKYS